MSELKELRRLKDEERALMNIASKLSDQVNRLKVEELALLNMIRLNEGKNSTSETVVRAEGVSGNQVDAIHIEEGQNEEFPEGDNSEMMETSERKHDLVPVDLKVGNQDVVEVEEEEEEDDLEMMAAFNDPL